MHLVLLRIIIVTFRNNPTILAAFTLSHSTLSTDPCSELVSTLCPTLSIEYTAMSGRFTCVPDGHYIVDRPQILSYLTNAKNSDRSYILTLNGCCAGHATYISCPPKPYPIQTHTQSPVCIWMWNLPLAYIVQRIVDAAKCREYHTLTHTHE